MDALKLYESTYLGKQDTDLATILQGRQLIGILQDKSARYRGGLGLPAASLLAQCGGFPVKFLPVSELIEAGFPEDKPIHLQLKIEQGAARSTDDDFGDELINPLKTQNGILLEVRDTLDVIQRFNEKGLERVFSEIEIAAGRIPLKVTTAADIQAPPAADPDPHVSQNIPASKAKK